MYRETGVFDFVVCLRYLIFIKGNESFIEVLDKF